MEGTPARRRAPRRSGEGGETVRAHVPTAAGPDPEWISAPDSEAEVLNDHRLVGALLHELNNALLVSRGNVEYLASRLRDSGGSIPDPLRRDCVAAVDDATVGLDHLARMTDACRAHVSGRTAPMTCVDLAEVARTSAALAGCAAGGCELIVEEESGGGRAYVVGDFGELCQLVVNLGLNAIEACRTRTTGTNIIRLGVNLEDRFAGITVDDNGPGFSRHVGPRLFEFGESEPGAVRGRGIGMWVVARIARRHGGSVDVTSTPGEGTRVCVRLPRRRTGGG